MNLSSTLCDAALHLRGGNPPDDEEIVDLRTWMELVCTVPGHFKYHIETVKRLKLSAEVASFTACLVVDLGMEKLAVRFLCSLALDVEAIEWIAAKIHQEVPEAWKEALDNAIKFQP